MFGSPAASDQIRLRFVRLPHELRRSVAILQACEVAALCGAEAEDLENGLGLAERPDDPVTRIW